MSKKTTDNPFYPAMEGAVTEGINKLHTFINIGIFIAIIFLVIGASLFIFKIIKSKKRG